MIKREEKEHLRAAGFTVPEKVIISGTPQIKKGNKPRRFRCTEIQRHLAWKGRMLDDLTFARLSPG